MPTFVLLRDGTVIHKMEGGDAEKVTEMMKVFDESNQAVIDAQEKAAPPKPAIQRQLPPEASSQTPEKTTSSVSMDS